MYTIRYWEQGRLWTYCRGFDSPEELAIYTSSLRARGITVIEIIVRDSYPVRVIG